MEKTILKITAYEDGMVGTSMNQEPASMDMIAYSLCGLMTTNHDFGKIMLETIHKILQPGGLDKLHEHTTVVPDLNDLLK